MSFKTVILKLLSQREKKGKRMETYGTLFSEQCIHYGTP
jgi:hypothetical protein